MEITQKGGNEVKGKQIKTLEDLERAAKEKRAVFQPGSHKWSMFQKPKPAGWVIHLQGPQILALIRSGLYIYNKPKAKVSMGGPPFASGDILKLKIEEVPDG